MNSLFIQAFFFSWLWNIIKKIAELVLDLIGKIIELIFGFVAKLIMNPFIEVLYEVFVECVMKPGITIWIELFKIRLELILAVLKILFQHLLYRLFMIIKDVINFFNECFEVMSGVKRVYVYNGLTSGSGVTAFVDTQAEKVSNGYTRRGLLSGIVGMNVVSDILLMLTAISMIFAAVFTLYQLAKLATGFGKKLSVGKVLRSLAKTMLTFLTVPMMIVIGINLAQILITKTCEVIRGVDLTSTQYKLGDALAYSVLVGANSDSSWDGFKEKMASGGNIYNEITAQAADNIWKVNFVVAILGEILLLLILAACIISIITNLFQVLFLYVVSPFFTATIPLDDGQVFGRWRDMFISKMVYSYTMIVIMEIYCTLMPVIVSTDLSLGAGKLADSLVRILLMIGTGWSVILSSRMISELLGQKEMDAGTHAVWKTAWGSANRLLKN